MNTQDRTVLIEMASDQIAHILESRSLNPAETAELAKAAAFLVVADVINKETKSGGAIQGPQSC